MKVLAQRLTPSPQAIVWGLLITNGFLIALMLALSKTATTQGMAATTYAFWQTLIAGSILLLRSAPIRQMLNRRLLTYFLISGLSGIAIPNVTGFFLVSKLGTGFTGIMYALPPIFTFLMATSMGLEQRSWRKLTGLLIAVMACAWIILERHSDLSDSSPIWFLLGLLIPAALSIGNIYRSVAWPGHTAPMTLAAGTLLACAVSLALFASLTNTPLVSLDFGPGLVVVVVFQGVLTALAYLCSFEVQKRATPVFFSQLGSVAAVFGLLIGVIWFREQYSLTIWLGVLAVLTGLWLGNWQGSAGKQACPQPVRAVFDRSESWHHNHRRTRDAYRSKASPNNARICRSSGRIWKRFM
ncbi:DMT family transporter [Marinobacter szutsaonensis]